MFNIAEVLVTAVPGASATGKSGAMVRTHYTNEPETRHILVVLVRHESMSPS